MQRFYDAFGKQLRGARRTARLSQEDIARRVGLTRSSIANIELGRQRIALHMLYALAGALDVPPQTLLPLGSFASDQEILAPDVLEGLSPKNQRLIQEVLEGGVGVSS